MTHPSIKQYKQKIDILTETREIQQEYEEEDETEEG